MSEDERTATSDDQVGMIWWNALTEAERAYWLKRADSARAVDAWRAYKRELGSESSE